MWSICCKRASRSSGIAPPQLVAAGLSGTARYAGGLIGTALERSGLPPVMGDAGLVLDLGTRCDGTASFTSLTGAPRRTSPETLRRRRPALPASA